MPLLVWPPLAPPRYHLLFCKESSLAGACCDARQAFQPRVPDQARRSTNPKQQRDRVTLQAAFPRGAEAEMPVFTKAHAPWQDRRGGAEPRQYGGGFADEKRDAPSKSPDDRPRG